ncbi:hypothetical protein PNOK_0591000 [Pyrrhoderma noxium]|uniref:Uncharacterized protein n=1 Tax=Pyrrhoderma noxium TaxID=2282107 RepID=A0A286UHG4_9AGAM|nr:hypothetical protein PNOK_0591000 [Pyrrhoderma noxium]
MADLPQDHKTPSNSNSALSSSSNLEKEPCQIIEILQHICSLENKRGTAPEIHCFPVPRIFRLCPNQPGVEITRTVTVDSSTQDILLPPNAKHIHPNGKPCGLVSGSLRAATFQLYHCILPFLLIDANMDGGGHIN